MDSNLLFNIIENQAHTIILLNQDKRVIYVNKIGRILVGSDTDQMLGNYFECPHAVRECVECQKTSYCSTCEINKALDEVLEKGCMRILQDLRIVKAEMEICVDLKVTRQGDHIVLEFVDINMDFTYLNLLHHLMDVSKDLIFFKNKNLIYEYMNKAYATFCDKPKKYLIGKTDQELVEQELLPQEAYLTCCKGDQIAFEQGYYYGVEQLGEQWFRVTKEKVDEGILCTARDITEEVKVIKKAEYDELTNLYNRRKLKGFIKAIYKERIPHHVVLIDLDNLRELNNQHGHAKGDLYLEKLGEILRSIEVGTYFRIGGDEFVGLIPLEVDIEKLIKTLFDRISELKLEPQLTISVGVKQLDLDKDYIQNYKEVDRILYLAKEQGKNQVVIG